MRILLLIIFIPVLGFAQQDSLQRRRDIFRFADGIIYTYSAPLRWEGNDWLKFGGVLAGTAALSLLDEPVRKFWQQQDSPFLDGVERVGFHYGKPYSATIFTGGFYLAGVLFKNEWCKETGLVLGTTLLTSGLLQTIMKDVIGRARPVTEVGPYKFKSLSKSPAYHSFPSGHASVALAISLVLAKRIDNVPIKIFFYALATTTAVSRMYIDAHWFSDIVIGGVLGWFCADAAIQRIEANRFKIPGKKPGYALSVYPFPGGLTLRASIK